MNSKYNLSFSLSSVFLIISRLNLQFPDCFGILIVQCLILILIKFNFDTHHLVA